MIQVHDIIFCLNSSNLSGQGVSANTVLSAVNPEYIPGLFSFSTIVAIIGIDISKEHILKLVFASDEEVVGTIEGPLPPIDDPSNLPVEYKGINLSVNWNNVNLKKEGNYTLSVYVDDNKLKDKSIYVKGKNQ